METSRRFVSSFIAVVMLLASQAEPRADQGFSPPDWSTERKTFVLGGFGFRNGDLFAVDAVGMALFDTFRSGRCIAMTARGELGVGGAAAAVGLATNLAEAPCKLSAAFLQSGIVSLEARVERTYGPTGWRRTMYVGPQVSLATMWWWKPSLGWMFDAHDAADNHVQFGLGVLF
jgi:hypothetical protein